MRRSGTLAAIGAYALWGAFPIYWKAIQEVPAFETLCHRITWSFLFLVILLLSVKRWGWIQQVKERPTTLLTFLGTATLLSLNWFIYIWAVNAERLVDTSMGYFINPLLSVLLGVFFLKERLRLWQWISVGIAAAAVTYLTLSYGHIPWVALTLAGTFGFYGLLRKTAPLGAIEGLSIETAFMLLPALAYLVYLESSGIGAFGHAPAKTNALLSLSGVATALPLILFNYGAKRIALATVGILQYIAPTGQFLLGVLAYGEAFEGARVTGFIVIWAALIIYSVEGIVERRKRNPAPSQLSPG